MSRTNSIILAAVGGAILAALIANYLTTEKGKQLLNSALDSLKDISGRAIEYAKTNVSEIVRETTNTIGPVVREKLAQQVTKGTPAHQQ